MGGCGLGKDLVAVVNTVMNMHIQCKLSELGD